MKDLIKKILKEERLGTGINLHCYVYASEFSNWVAFTYGLDSSDVYDRLLDNDYIEGSMGSRWSLDSYTQQEIDRGNEIAKWYADFMREFGLSDIQLKYGG